MSPTDVVGAPCWMITGPPSAMECSDDGVTWAPVPREAFGRWVSGQSPRYLRMPGDPLQGVTVRVEPEP